MKRVRASALLLMNWKGVFYERYGLGDNVTILEGTNGAGKTTVMIAAYVVMLPDMTKLRFTNVGENDFIGGDKGIWGRLGNPNRPSYAVIEFNTGGSQIFAGVQLERKGEPSVELTTFLISEMPADVSLQDTFLLRTKDQDLIPELNDLRDNVTRLGGRMAICKSLKEYFTTLFELGITPLRLVTEDERARLNDMLRASMSGGISRALTSEFRSFLLKEETGLADTLGRMRNNLDACRRTRTEVRESRELEGEISGVYEAGHAMFCATLLSVRDRAAELRQRVVDAQGAKDLAFSEFNRISEEVSQKRAEWNEVLSQLQEAKTNHASFMNWLAKIVAANAIANRMAGYEAALRALSESLVNSDQERKQAEKVKIRCMDERQRAEQTYRLAVDGLADLQKGLEELHRRADAHRAVTRRLAEAKRALDKPQVSADDLDSQTELTSQEIRALDTESSELDARIGNAETHRSDHADAMSALTTIMARQADANTAYEEARNALRNLSALDGVAAEIHVRLQWLETANKRFERETNVLKVAAALILPDEPLATSADVKDALNKTELGFRSSDEEARREENAAHDLDHTIEIKEKLHSDLQIRTAKWRELNTIATKLEQVCGSPLRTAAALESAQKALDEKRDEVRRKMDEVDKSLEEAKSHVYALEQSGGVFHPDLLVARDLVDGQLLAGYIDDIDPNRAGVLQAQLGPLADAIVVENPGAAADALAGRERDLESIWLMDGSSIHQYIEPDEALLTNDQRDVKVEQDGVVRTTRVSQKPTLGRKARQRLIAELRSQIEEFERSLNTHKALAEEIRLQRESMALLMRESITLELGDPTEEIAALAIEIEKVRARKKEHLAAGVKLRAVAVWLSRRARELQNLLTEAYLLDERDLHQRREEAEQAWQAAQSSRIELARVADARIILEQNVDALRRAPILPDDADNLKGHLVDLRARRERLYLAMDALRYVAANRDALAWGDAEKTLSTRQELVPGLKAQCDQAETARSAATDAETAAELAWNSAREHFRSIDNRNNAIMEQRDQAKEELAASGVDDPSDLAVEMAKVRECELSKKINELDLRERGLSTEIAQLDVHVGAREQELRVAEERLAKEEKEWKPANEHWERLRAKAEANRLITPAISTRLLSAAANSVHLRTEARLHAGLLKERLSKAKGGTENIDQINELFSGQEQTAGEDLLGAWLIARDWLRRRVPAQIAEVDDPFEALQKLRNHLAALSARLETQEGALRGASEDVARGIDVHIRSAQRQVRQLTGELNGVRFGTIRAIQIVLRRDERMDGVLSALRKGDAQELLFSPNMPVEDALEALFTRYGGKGPTVGHKLLDYREYIDLAVEIQRQTSTQWERVNPSRLSTGEAIGVGTALMMVVLTAWERSASLFRAKRSLGTLRFLFLDEANRLSQDNLEVLFELCAALNLQLLIAAPEVARAPGCTTYRLVRRTTPDGGEEVVVSGRRAAKKG